MWNLRKLLTYMNRILDTFFYNSDSLVVQRFHVTMYILTVVVSKHTCAVNMHYKNRTHTGFQNYLSKSQNVKG